MPYPTVERIRQVLLSYRPPYKVRKYNVCWPWKTAGRNGYGFLKIDGVTRGVHRWSAAAWLGLDIADPAQLACHNCPGGDNPRCWNPAHLFVGTAIDNNADRGHKTTRVPDEEIAAIAQTTGLSISTVRRRAQRKTAQERRERTLRLALQEIEIAAARHGISLDKLSR